MVCAALAEIGFWPALQRWNDGPHPVAALAWANVNCGAELKLRPGTPRLQAEDLLAMTATIDATEQQSGRSRICSIATALAAPVALNVDLPSRNGSARVAAIKAAPLD
jgi:hypothetical protein